jgi:hypothetical protein
MFADIFEKAPTPPFKARVIRETKDPGEVAEGNGGKRTMSITYHRTAEEARAAAEAVIEKLRHDRNEIDAGWLQEDYTFVVGPAVEE